MRYEIMGGWVNVDEELLNVYPSPHTIKKIKLRRIRGAVACSTHMGEETCM
jgi:hypothetical protein